MMTVLTQPFHMLVYYVLIMIPMGITKTDGLAFGSGSNIISLIYALVAISFIRPAEKQLRELFGMGGGISGAGSYDSGVAPFKAAAKAAMQVGAIAATAMGNPVVGTALSTVGNSIKSGDDGARSALPAADTDDVNATDIAAMQSNNKTDEDTNTDEDTKSNQNLSEGSENSKISSGNANEDDNVQLSEGKSEKSNKWYDHLTGKSAARQLGAAHDMLIGKKSIVDALAAPYEFLGNTKLGEQFKGTKFGRSLSDGGLKIKDFAKRFEAAGGLTELYKGFNSVRDTMFLNGAPGDWKSTATQMDEYKKKNDEKNIYNFTHNEGNKNYMLSADGGNLLAKYQEIYKDKSPEYQKYMAEQEAEKKLESMAKAFVPYGITDVATAHSLKKDQNKYGYSAEEAIRQASKFNKFNSSTSNISVVNKEYNLQDSKTPVSAKIPDAKDYFNRGITDIKTMVDADKIAVKLSEKLGDKLSSQMKKDIATAVAKKGGVNYGGSDENIRKVIDDLTKKGN